MMSTSKKKIKMNSTSPSFAVVEVETAVLHLHYSSPSVSRRKLLPYLLRGWYGYWGRFCLTEPYGAASGAPPSRGGRLHSAYAQSQPLRRYRRSRRCCLALERARRFLAPKDTAELCRRYLVMEFLFFLLFFQSP